MRFGFEPLHCPGTYRQAFDAVSRFPSRKDKEEPYIVDENTSVLESQKIVTIAMYYYTWFLVKTSRLLQQIPGWLKLRAEVNIVRTFDWRLAVIWYRYSALRLALKKVDLEWHHLNSRGYKIPSRGTASRSLYKVCWSPGSAKKKRLSE